MSNKYYENKVLGGNTAYFKYYESSGQVNFQEGLDEFLKAIIKPEITAVLVEICEPKAAWSAKGQKAWLENGELADKNGITKWAVICTEDSKLLTLRYLVKGAKTKRNYKSLVSKNESECYKWLGLE